ncbi:MAG: YihA family ribosome biogenesis GTP-binding protein [Alphaproteobacteria bacterium]|nr:YihA family ribosome biogenesis GTP-binding protein [Alphaproteobacteria bacterium]
MSATKDKQLFNSAAFFAAAGAPGQLPKERAPEIAVIGRSNVGKSSLLNALASQKALARTSRTPGRTQQLNFFTVGDRFVLVDLPGYGFAKASGQKRHAWGELSLHYLSTRAALRRVLVLIDARRGVMPVDLGIMDFLAQHQVAFQAVLTKTDAIKPAEQEQVLHAVTETLRIAGAGDHTVRMTSSSTGAGITGLRAEIIAAIK